MSQQSWELVSGDLRDEWDIAPISRSRPWDEIQDDVRFGWEQAMRPEFDGAEWEDVEDVLQERWEQSYPHADYEDWRSVVDAVRLGFERAKEQVS